MEGAQPPSHPKHWSHFDPDGRYSAAVAQKRAITRAAAAKPNPANAAFDHEIQLVSYQLLMEAATGETPPSLDLVFLVKTKTPQVIRVKSRPADEHRKRRVVALLETAVQGISEDRFHPQPGMHCSWCQFRNECAQWLPGMDWHAEKAA